MCYLVSKVSYLVLFLPLPIHFFPQVMQQLKDENEELQNMLNIIYGTAEEPNKGSYVPPPSVEGMNTSDYSDYEDEEEYDDEGWDGHYAPTFVSSER